MHLLSHRFTVYRIYTQAQLLVNVGRIHHQENEYYEELEKGQKYEWKLKTGNSKVSQK